MIGLLKSGDGAAWLLFGGFWLLLLALAAAETLRPLHAEPVEARGRLVTNFGMGLIAAALYTLLPLTSVAAAQWADVEDFGLLNVAPVAAAVAAGATLLAWSLANYWLHRAFHHGPWLWRLHRIHHVDTAVDLSTGFRNHPGEVLATAVARAGLAAALGLSVPALIAYEAAAFVASMWSHANLRLPARADRILRWLLVTPAMHHVHHSSTRCETDSNYGELLSVWDRLFGTYRPSDADSLATLRFGLGASDDEGAASLHRQLLSPLARAERR
ncbi:MAG TPA: sterol desaturase family protein [Allosphingosinicella sp.]|nr:sterol desaturase family protein [Allosphingosinicella sp.]